MFKPAVNQRFDSFNKLFSHDGQIITSESFMHKPRFFIYFFWNDVNSNVYHK